MTLDNVALVPASLLPYKAQWQQLANELPRGSVLIITPLTGPQETTLQKISTHLQAHGRRVKTLASDRFFVP